MLWVLCMLYFLCGLTPLTIGPAGRFVYRLDDGRKTLESLEPADLRTARCAMFGPCLMRLIGVLMVLMRYPEDVDELAYDEVTFCRRPGLLVFHVGGMCGQQVGELFSDRQCAWKNTVVSM